MSFETGAYQNAVATLNPAGAPHPAPGDPSFAVRVKPVDAVFTLSLSDSCSIPNHISVQFGGHPLAYGVESTRWVKNKKRVVSLMPTPGSAPGAVPTPLFVIRSFGSGTRFFRIYNAATDEVVITVRTRDPSSSDKERLIRPHAFGWFGEDTSLAPFFSVDGDAWSSGCRAIGQPHREPLFTLSKLGLNCQYALLVEPHLDSALMLACTIGLLDLYGPASARII